MTHIRTACNILLVMKNDRLDRKKLELTDGRIVLRPYDIKDVAKIYEGIQESMTEMFPWLPFVHEGYSIKETRDHLRKCPGNWKKGLSYSFSIFDARDGVLLGGCGLNRLDKENRNANLGYWVRKSRMGEGVAPAATRLLTKWGFDVLKLVRIEILVAVENQRSLRVAEKAGAKREGVLRNRLTVRDKVYDAMMHSLVPEDFQEA